MTRKEMKEWGVEIVVCFATQTHTTMIIPNRLKLNGYVESVIERDTKKLGGVSIQNI